MYFRRSLSNEAIGFFDPLKWVLAASCRSTASCPQHRHLRRPSLAKQSSLYPRLRHSHWILYLVVRLPLMACPL